MHLKFPKKNEPNRRQFLVKTGCSAMGITSMVNTLAHLNLMQGALNAQSSGGGYKALICVFLNGGNDSNNMLLPFSGTARTDYEAGRGMLTIPTANATTSLNALQLNATNIAECDPLGGYLGTLGVHPKFTHVKSMFDAGDLAFIANVGTLTFPGVTRANYSSAPKPPQLYSHSDQQVQWQSSIPDKPFTSGWGGRVAELLDPAYNPSTGNASMNISISGVNSFQVSPAGQVAPYIMTSGGLVNFTGYGTNYASAVTNPSLLFQASNYKNTEQGHRLKAFENVLQMTHASLMENAYNGVAMSARLTEGMVGTALQSTVGASGTTTLDSYFNNAFSGSGLSANNDFANQMKLVARLIAGRSALGNTRQIFFVQHGGYDTHISQIPAGSNTSGHTGLMNNLNCTLKGFADALKGAEVGNVWDNVVTFTASDFTRTFTPNKTDNTAGSDHAWGGHAIVMGGAVKGQRVYGKFPVLKLGTVTDSIDATGTRGLWIPSTPVDQYAAIMARWLGVDASTLGDIFPNLSRFVTLPSITSGNMDFLEV
ncbi:DUF1501 domain-containing protein [Verrucomicrobium sp. BvORR034]|jgi:uncharacterized protein (DUF1501 family)|uniref:DUF1501 domain-containing protein n=1 Tax=Verrucomicrobium sp. BvORR034 TaxID=1396418 RepID=UPI0006791965|nr:DUF1501 domain-containing protein [Verrucomicrobium sp. BvORR034]